MIAIIDYGAGNLKSVQKAFSYLGFESVITSEPETILSASHVVLPGVGSFGEAMHKLDAAGLRETIHKAIDSGVPFLGICLGLQLLFEESEESPGVKGLGVFHGKVVKIPPKVGYKIPHMGWDSIEINRECPLFKGIEGEPYVYFVHSYYPDAEDDSVVCARTHYTDTLKVGAWKKNVFAMQFHPEKSSDVGLMMLKNFAGLERGTL
jgi:glutamine amidotransferase